MSTPFRELMALARGEPVTGRALDALVRRLGDEDDAQEQLVDLLTRPEWYIDQIVGATPRLGTVLFGGGDDEDWALAERKLVGYLRTSLRRAAIDASAKRIRRGRLLDRRIGDALSAGDLVASPGEDGAELGVPAIDPSSVDAERRSERAWAAIDRALDAVVADQRKADARDTFAELVALARGDFTLRERVAAETSSATEAKRRYDARTRAHARLREALADALTALEVSGEISSEDADIARAVVRTFLTRRPNLAGSPVPVVERPA